MTIHKLQYTRFWVCLLVMLFVPLGVTAQQAVSSSGGTITDSGGSASITVGQIGYTYITDSGGSLQEGVQQAFDISPIPAPAAPEFASDELLEKVLDLNSKVFPNPTQTNITLAHGSSDLEDMHYELYDLQGRLVSKEQILNSSEIIEMHQLSSGTYVLHVFQYGIPAKSFKIVKN